MSTFINRFAADDDDDGDNDDSSSAADTLSDAATPSSNNKRSRDSASAVHFSALPQKKRSKQTTDDNDDDVDDKVAPRKRKQSVDNAHVDAKRSRRKEPEPERAVVEDASDDEDVHSTPPTTGFGSMPPPPPPPSRDESLLYAEDDGDYGQSATMAGDGGGANSLSMHNYALELLNEDVRKRSEKTRRSRVLEKWEYSRLAATSELECEGDLRCRLMDSALAYVQERGLVLSAQQKVILKAARAVSLAQFYGDSIQFHLPRLLGENAWSELRSELLIFMARRQGKTTVVSLLAACELVTQPLCHDICIYSNNGRASRMLLMMVYKFVRILAAQDAGFGGSIKSLNKNEGMSYTTRWGTVNTLSAFPAKEETLRGTGSKETTGTVILEELNFMPPGLVQKIIAPTLVRKRVKLIGITTISGFDSFVTPLANARFPDGRKVMLTLNFEMVCEDCKARGEPEKCKCLMADLPHWHLSTQLEKLEILLANNLDTYMQEMKNLATDGSITPAFDPRDVDFLRRPESTMRLNEIKANEIFVAVDPACGGDTSKMAIVSSIYVQGLMIVVGLGSINATGLYAPSEHKKVVVSHVRALRERLPGLAGARIVFVPESNGGGFASQDYALALIEEQVPHVYLMDEDAKHVGLRTDNASKKRMTILLSNALRAHALKFHPLLVTTGDAMSRDSMVTAFIDQCASFKRKLKMKKTQGEDDGVRQYTEIFSGKFGGRKDDFVMGGMINLMGRSIYMTKFEETYRNKRPLWEAT